MSLSYRSIVSVLVLSACASADRRAPERQLDDPSTGPAPEPEEPQASPAPSSDDEPPSEIDGCLDADGDGYGPGCVFGDDCAPLDPQAYSDAEELCGDAHDNDCDGLADEGCSCDATQGVCVSEPEPGGQTLGEFVFDLSRGFMGLDQVCGPARVTALDGSRTAIVSSIDEMVTTSTATTMGEVAREVLDPLIQSRDLESTVDAFTVSAALLVDDKFDPERRTLQALAQIFEADSILEERHLLAVAEGVLADERVPELIHSLHVLGNEPDGRSVAASSLLSVMSAGLGAQSATHACSGLVLDDLGTRLLDVRDMPERPELGEKALVVDKRQRDLTFDAKRTALAVGLELSRDALAARVHEDLTVVLDAALGPQQQCGADCLHYASADHPLADLTHVGVDLLRYDETQRVLAAVSTVLRERPEVAEALLMATGKLIKRARASNVALDRAEVLRVTRELLPLLSRIFETDGKTPRLLINALHELGHTARDFPERLKWTIDYASLEKSKTCSDSPPDFRRSKRVDYDKPRAGGNRSSLEQVIELLAAVDCGSVPLSGGKSVGVFVLDTVSGMKPSTVCGVTDVLLGALDVTGVVGDFFTKIALRTIGCGDADRVLRELDSLEDLAASGALDFLIPLDKVFAKQGQLKTLIGIFRIVAEDLQRDDDRDPATHSVFRPLLPILSALIEEGAADAVFDLLDLLVSVETTDAAGKRATLADVLVDMAAFVIRERTVPTRAGNVPKSSYLSELLSATERVAARLEGDDVAAAFTGLADHGTAYLEPAANGSLVHEEIIPFTRALLDGVTSVWALPRAQRDCYVNGWMNDADNLWTSPSLATSMRLLRLYTRSDAGRRLDTIAVDLLAPVPQNGAPSVFGPVLQVSAELVSLPPPGRALAALTPYLSTISDPARLDGPAILGTLDTLLERDDQRVFLGILQKAVDQGGNTPRRARAAILLDAYVQALAIAPDACSAEHRPWSARGLDSAVKTTLSFIEDPTYGVDPLFDALKELANNP